MPDASDPLARWGAEVRRHFGQSAASGNDEAPIIEELSLHLEDRYRELISRGASEDEARRRTLEELEHGEGLGRDLLRHVPRTSSPLPPPSRSGRWWAGLPGDVRYAVRLLLRERSFTIVALLTLALGVGAVTAMFSFVNGLLLRPLPYPNAERLVSVVGPGMIRPADLDLWREGARSIERFEGFSMASELLDEPDDVRRLSLMPVTEDYLPLLGARPIRGRLWAASEAGSADPRVIVISERIWLEVLRGADLSDRTLTLDGIAHVVVGVLPDEFHNGGYTSTDAWVPLAQREEEDLQGVALLREGATPEQAQAELSALTARVEALPIAEEFGRMLRLHMLRDTFTDGAKATVFVLFAASGCVLLLACANLANLLLSRAAGRGRELAIRNALGAGRGALLRQLAAEHVLLAIAGASLGVAMAWGVVRGLQPLLPTGFTRLPAGMFRIDLTVLAGTVLASLVTILLAGLAPTLASMRSAAPMTLLSRGTPGRSTRRWREALIAAEIAIAVMLLIGTTVLVRSYLTLRPSAPGYETRDRIVATLTLPADRAGNAELARRLMREIELAAPGARTAVSGEVPLSGNVSTARMLAIDGRAIEVGPGERPPSLEMNTAMPEYIHVLGVRIIRGRPLDRRDVAGAEPVVLLNQAGARRFWPDGEDPIGRRLDVEYFGGRTTLVVAGVYEDVRTSGGSTASRSQGLLPYPQWAQRTRVQLVVHVPPPSTFDAAALRAAVARVESRIPVGEITTLASIASRAVATPRYQMTMMSGFGVLALALALIGCYGVLAYSVAQRTREFGVRMALGAAPGAIRRAVLRRAVLLVVAGLIVGSAGAVAATRVLESSFYGVVPGDATTFVLVAAALLAVSMIAALLPASRAAAVDPVVALREE